LDPTCRLIVPYTMSNDVENERWSLWKSYVTVLEMLNERKFETPKPETFEDFNKDRESMTFVVSKKTGMRVMVMWLASTLLGAGSVTTIVDEMKKHEVDHTIVVVQGKITSYAEAAMRNLRSQKLIIETFSEKELQYNVIKHELVPRHIICSKATKDNVLEQYAVEKQNLQLIKSTDAICRFFGAQRGTLFKIVRPSETFPYFINEKGEKVELFDISYRLVV